MRREHHLAKGGRWQVGGRGRVGHPHSLPDVRFSLAACTFPPNAWPLVPLPLPHSRDTHRLCPTVGSRISAAHLPHGRCRTPRYVLSRPFATTWSSGTGATTGGGGGGRGAGGAGAARREVARPPGGGAVAGGGGAGAGSAARAAARADWRDGCGCVGGEGGGV